jgi:Methyltransferase small domain
VTVATQRVRDILATASITGRAVVIPQRLDRADYVAVNTVLTAIGGTWSRAERAHVFPHDPAAELAAILAGEPVPRPARTAEGFVPTPPELAEELVREHTGLAELDAPRVLEPSAGDGALVAAIRATAPEAIIVAVEPNTVRAAHLGAWPGVSLVTTTFEEYATSLTPSPSDTDAEGPVGRESRFDAVVMNPPFAVPGHPTIWIDHLRLAWRLLTPGGQLTAIVPRGYTFRTDRRHTAIRALVEQVGGTHQPLPDDAFGPRGIRTVLLTMDKPSDYLDGTEPAPPRQRGTYQPSPEEVAERRAADRDLTQLVHHVLDDPEAAARIHTTLEQGGVSAKVLGYSPRNQAMLLTQCQARGIRLVDVDSPAGWRTRGRKLRPHVAGLRIVAPRGETRTNRCAATDTVTVTGSGADPGGEAGQDTVLFRMISVFELSQTEPITEPITEPTGNPPNRTSRPRRGRGRRAA